MFVFFSNQTTGFEVFMKNAHMPEDKAEGLYHSVFIYNVSNPRAQPVSVSPWQEVIGELAQDVHCVSVKRTFDIHIRNWPRPVSLYSFPRTLIQSRWMIIVRYLNPQNPHFNGGY